MDTLIVVVPGPPKGKAAARHSSKGFTYTPTPTRHYMQFIAQCAVAEGAMPLDVPCQTYIQAYFPIPESYSKKKAAAARDGTLKYTKKPDRDNLSKLLDALNGVAFRDDALIYREVIEKHYSDNPRLVVTIKYDLPVQVCSVPGDSPSEIGSPS